jgi:hypothetical protein
MATDIFNRGLDFGGSFASDKATLKLPALASAIGGGPDLTGFLVQNLNVNYQQQITKLYEVGGTKIYYVGGRTQGQATLSRIIGPKIVAKAFYENYGDVCRISEEGNNIEFELEGASCGADGNSPPGAKAKYTAKFCVVTTVGFTVQAQDMLINEQVTLMIGSLEYDGNPAGV